MDFSHLCPGLRRPRSLPSCYYAIFCWCSPGTSAEGHRSIAEGLLLQALAPFVRSSLQGQSCGGKARAELELLEKLVTAPPREVPPACDGRQTIPDMATLAPPVHLPIEKERVRLQV